LFFGISTREALLLDPQERLFLETCWRTLEDAGVTRSALNDQYGGRVGVFVGVTKSEHALYGADLPAGAERPRVSFSSVANRVSHVLNLHGPSQPVDTMCSSSLTAVHQACEALRAGDCDLAFAGGVNLYLHPSTYVDLCASNMLSDDGLCRSFGAGGSGFVPGEGAGCVLLKPLSRALSDGDRIDAVIRASAVNHGGRTHGFTVPNPVAQRDLIRTVLDRAGVDARTVSYVEAHGTGTELGDPIEVAALTQAFAADTTEHQFCALGSAKSNIGHLEAAAGIAGLIKVVLQLRNGVLAPTLHADEVNPNLDLKNSPFVLQRRASPWTVANNESLRATVSSFGAGGANACVLVEQAPMPQYQPDGEQETQIAVLSARSEEQLLTQAADLAAWIEARSTASVDDPTAVLSIISTLTGVAIAELDVQAPLADLGLGAVELRHLAEALGLSTMELASTQTAHDLSALAGAVEGNTREKSNLDLERICATLRTGREAFGHRVAIRVTSTNALARALADLAAGNTPSVPIWRGRADENREALAALNQSPEITSALQRLFIDRDLDRLAGLWVRGVAVDWTQLEAGCRVAPLHLPGHPFEHRRLWIGDAVPARLAGNKQWAGEASSPSTPAIKPFVQTDAVEPENLEKVANTVDMNEAVHAAMVEILAASLDLKKHEIDPSLSFADYGLDSILGVRFVEDLNERLSIELETSCIFDHASVERLSSYIVKQCSPSLDAVRSEVTVSSSAPFKARATASVTSPAPTTLDGVGSASGVEPIAIVGMSGRFPGSSDLDALWSHIVSGDELLGPVTRWELPDTVTCRRGGFIDDIDRFDALFFNISGAEASYMDPQQRVFLEGAWAALENAGYAGDDIAGQSCGVYVGCCGGDYQDLFISHPSPQSLWGNMASVIPARIAYALDLKGPALA
ncbi:MAG TPA: beta-ketoacyl synthase N-terminal-like domain-containing protein, partial [Magnetovibrio sp.]